MATLYLQKRDERRGGNRLAGTDGDPAAGGEDGTSKVVLASGSLEGKDMIGMDIEEVSVPQTVQPGGYAPPSSGHRSA